MPHDIERGGGLVPSLPILRSDLDRYEPPSMLTQAGRRDAKAVAEHQYQMRQLLRDAEVQAARLAKDLYVTLVEEAAEDVLLTQTKLKLKEQHNLSRLLAEDDPVLQAEYGVLDGTRNQKRRKRLLEFGR
jgi:hypothetical protein